MKHPVNTWTKIPVDEYEAHMSHPAIGQHQLLSALTKKYINLVKPTCCLFLGVAGGNGLEHIDNNMVKSVYAVDINQEYLDKTYQRYQHIIKSLTLLNIDVSKKTETICRSDFIWAALILEYTGIEKALLFSKKNISDDGQLIITIQSNNGVTAISDTGIKSIQNLGAVFQIIDMALLISRAAGMGFNLIDLEENLLPNGKSLITVRFKNIV